MNDPRTGLTDAEMLAALGTYIKVLTGMEKELRIAVEKDMSSRRVEKVGAYLPDGTKMASVSRSGGRKTAKVTNPAWALIWVRDRYPREIVESINPAFLKKLTDYALSNCAIGELGVDPKTGEELPFITVEQGNPYVTITTTVDGFGRMEALAHGFAGMLEADTDENGGPPQRLVPEDQYDPSWVDRLEGVDRLRADRPGQGCKYGHGPQCFCDQDEEGYDIEVGPTTGSLEGDRG